MIKKLLLFSKKSAETKQSYPSRLTTLLNESGGGQYDYYYYEDLVFYIDNNKTTVLAEGKDIKEYDLVYHRRWQDNEDEALAAYIYLNKHNVIQLDQELDRKGSTNKLTQVLRLWEHGMPIPKTLFAARTQLLEGEVQDLIEEQIKYPCVVKSTSGTRGSDNYLIKNPRDLKELIEGDKDIEYLVQQFIPNDGDYRVLVYGSKPSMVIHRKAASGVYKNNISLGGKASKVDIKNINDKALKDAVKAANVFGRDIAGVDLVFDKNSNNHYFFEVNRAPQIENSSYEKEKIDLISKYFNELISNKNPFKGQKNVSIGVSTHIDFVGYKKLKNIPARIDTGARTSSLWASEIKIIGSKAKFKMFGPGSTYYTNKYVTMPFVEHRIVTSSTGHEQERIVVKFPIRIKGKKIVTKFTLSDRSTQTYPVLIGRNTLRGHFLVDSSNPGEAAIYKYPEEQEEFKEVEIQ